MSTTPNALPPPPGPNGPSATPTDPAAGASPAPAQPSAGMQQGTQLLISVVNNLRAIAKQFPGTAPKVAEINNLIREMAAEVMKSQQAPEAQAPPVGG